jgi:hypothetical protein
MKLQPQQRPTWLVLIGIALLGAAGLLKLPSVAAGSRSAGFDDAAQAKIARESFTPTRMEYCRSTWRQQRLHLHAGKSGSDRGSAHVCRCSFIAVVRRCQGPQTEPDEHGSRNHLLAGATQRSDSDPNDKTSPAIHVGPHWMIMWPFDPKTTGLPTTHRDQGAYIMWAGSPYAHLPVMDRP